LHVGVETALRLTLRILISRILAILVGQRCEILAVLGPLKYLFGLGSFFLRVEFGMLCNVVGNVLVSSFYFLRDGLGIGSGKELRLLQLNL